VNGAIAVATMRRSRSRFGRAHLRWCTDIARIPRTADDANWRSAFDRVADELAAHCAGPHPTSGPGPTRTGSAIRLAELCFARGTPGEVAGALRAAAELAIDDRRPPSALHHAAGAADRGTSGTEALALRRQRADAALRAGDRAGRRSNLARAPS